MRTNQNLVLINWALFAGALTVGVAASCASAKPTLRAADQLLQDACEVLALRMGEKTHANAEQIIATTCAVEGFTRTLRETLLSQQIEAARAAGVAVLPVSSDLLLDPYEADAE